MEEIGGDKMRQSKGRTLGREIWRSLIAWRINLFSILHKALASIIMPQENFQKMLFQVPSRIIKKDLAMAFDEYRSKTNERAWILGWISQEFIQKISLIITGFVRFQHSYIGNRTHLVRLHA